jgi:hypothetical protein
MYHARAERFSHNIDVALRFASQNPDDAKESRINSSVSARCLDLFGLEPGAIRLVTVFHYETYP